MKAEQKHLMPVIVANFLGYLAIFISFTYFGPYLAGRFKLSGASIGAIAAIWPTILMLASFLFGRLADHWGVGKVSLAEILIHV